MDDVIIRYVSLPQFVRGQVLMDFNGDYNIYINAKLSYDMQCETLEHELRHVRCNDFRNNRLIAEAEGR